MDRLTGLRGPAAVRGQLWGRSVWRRRRGQIWPAYDDSPRVRAIAATKVSDLVGSDRDPELLEALARICAAAAQAEYSTPTPRPGTASTYD